MCSNGTLPWTWARWASGMILVGLTTVACHHARPRGQPEVYRPAVTLMLKRLSELSEGELGWDATATTFCFLSSPGAPDLARLHTMSVDQTTTDSLRALDPRFVPGNECDVSDAHVITSDRGAPAYLMWVDSISDGAQSAWGTVVVGPGLGESRGFLCALDGRAAPSCAVAWFNE